MKKINFQKVVDQVIQKAPGLVAGAVASKYIGKGIDSVFKGKATPTVTAGLTVLAGALLPGFVGSAGKKGQFMQSVADGIMAQGALKLGAAMKIPGLEGVAGTDDGWDAISGKAQEDYMSGTDTANSVSGAD